MEIKKITIPATQIALLPDFYILSEQLESTAHLQMSGGIGSFKSFLAYNLFIKKNNSLLYILNDTEEAAYALNDLESLLPKEKILYYQIF